MNSIWGSFQDTILNEKTNLEPPYCLPQRLHHITSEPVLHKILLSPCSWEHLSHLFHHSHSAWCEVISYYSLICIFLTFRAIEYLFMYLYAICMSSLEKKCLLKFFAHFKHWITWVFLFCFFLFCFGLVFCYWVVQVPYIFWIFVVSKEKDFSSHLLYTLLYCVLTLLYI